MDSTPAPDVFVTSTISYPILDEIAIIQHGLDEFPYPGDSDFVQCRGLAKSTDKRCRIAKGTNEHRASELLAEFKLMREFPNSTDIYDDIEEFLEVTHCHIHEKNVLPIFHHRKGLLQSLRASPASDSTVSEHEFDCIFSSYLSEDLSTPASSPRSEILIQELVTSTKSDEISEENIDQNIAKGAAEDNAQDMNETVTETVTEAISVTTTEFVIEAVSEPAVSPEVERAEKDEKIVHQQEDSDLELIGLGLNSFERKGSLRNTSPVIKEVYKSLRPEQQCEGLVYILEHTSGALHIGYSTSSSKGGVDQACERYATGTEVVYITSAPFYAAAKAQRLAQVILQHQDLIVRDCQQCGGAHNDWFKASSDAVRETVVGMENFVQMPAYSLQDGEMKLSPAGKTVIEAMHGFSMARLEGIMATQDVRVDQETPETPEKTSRVTNAVDSSPQWDIERTTQNQDDPPSQTFSSVARPKGKKRDSFEWSKIKNLFTRTPEKGAGDSEGNKVSRSEKVPPPSPDVESVSRSFFWALFPHEIKSQNGGAANAGLIKRVSFGVLGNRVSISVSQSDTKTKSYTKRTEQVILE